MPSDVIMPALGMAQDTGLIVSWLKQPGDSVQIGDGLMEVETDKAVVEVEAQADGFLTNVSAAAGDQVAVGSVVAVISETAEAVHLAVPKNTVETLGGSGQQADLPDGIEIIMPALGMAQDTGLIVSWQKNAGDPVEADDVLLEVETDKSVMEVAAGHSGFVAAILADAQVSIPVGSVIAIISANKPERTVTKGQRPPSENTVPERSDTAPGIVLPSPVQKHIQPIVSDNPGGQILASPKARRFALEQGLDLALLVKQGLPQPYRVADLETLKTQSARTEYSSIVVSPCVGQKQIEAWVPSAECDEFIHWVATDSDVKLEPVFLWLSFASGAFRAATEAGQEALIVETRQMGGEDQRYVDADRTPVSSPVEDEGLDTLGLIIRDISGSEIVRSTTTADGAPVLTIGRKRDELIISLDYHDGHFPEDTAINFVTEFTKRLANPLRHLL